MVKGTPEARVEAKVQVTYIPEGWLPIDKAPKDEPILGWCIHEADPYFLPDNTLTLYGGHAEGLAHVIDGPHVLEWGGRWDDRSCEDPAGCSMPDWWFLRGSDFEVAANPVYFQRIPTTERHHCPRCNSRRPGLVCWKCHTATITPSDHWTYPEMPDIEYIKLLARNVGYNLVVHGSQERDLDLVAVPWDNECASATDLIAYIARCLDARVGEIEQKPWGRLAACIQVNGYVKLIDLSVCPRKFS